MSCIFCKIINKEIPSKIRFESDDLLAFDDVMPQSPVHIVIIPKIHIPTTEEINENNYNITGKMVLCATNLAKDLNLDGYRLVMNCNEIAGQSVFHIHLHLLAGRQMNWPPG